MPDNISKLYNALQDIYELGSEEDFRKYLSDSKKREALRKELQAEYDTGDEAAFSAYLGFGQPVQKPAPAPAPAQPVVKQTTGQVNPTVNTSTQPKQDEQPQKQGGWQPTWQEKMGMQMQLDETMRQVKQSQQDFNTRMENIRKGNTLGKTSEVKFNPESGKMERRYYTTHGDEVATPLEQSRLNLKYRDEWEATTPEGRKHREKRIENDFERRVGASLDKYDPDNAAAMVWQQAEDKASESFREYVDGRRQPTLANALHDMADASNVTGGVGMDNIEYGIKAFTEHLKYHDLQRMADDAWNMLGKEKQQSIIEDMYGALKNRYPQATEQQLQQAATEMAREQSDRRMYELAVAKNAPKDAAEYFIRKVAAGNAMGTLMQAAARAQAGTTGDWEAREDAEQRFEKQGHKVAGIAGTVTGFALDPLTWASAGAGGAAVKGTTWLGGKMIGEAAMRKFGTTLGGRMLGGAIGGAVNFGTYEAGSEALDQMKWGGYIDEETGERKDGFSFGNVAGRAGHGLMMGAVTGVIAPYLGNVSDKLVRATESTVGKMGIRAGELGVGTVAEGTIFAVPEIIDTYGQYGDLINSLSDETSPNYIADEQERAAKIEELRNSRGDALMDVWTDNMAMIAGFKAQHLLKSAPRVIYDLARSKNGKAGFETRLRSILDGRGDLALTEDEKKELERRGYGDLKDLTEEYIRYAEAKEEYDKARPTTTDASRMIEGGDGQAELPYNRFVELMTDNSVSEAARAKMYYYLTGHGLPMSTVMGSSILEDKDADGNVTGYTVQSFGANGVITSRSFGDKKRADVEANRINRQAELNGFDVGERYYDWQGDNKRMYEACEGVAEETGAPANLLFDLMKRKTEAMNEVELEWAEKILNAYNGLGDKYGSSEVRAAINDEFGIDVDKAIRKERNRRSEQEQKAVDEYANRLFADVKRKQEEAAERGEAPVDPDAPTSNSQIAALLGIDDGEQGDPVSAAFNRGHEADAQERQDIAIELADPNNAEAQEAWNGVVQRINEDAAYMVAQQREQTKQMQHTDGSLRPAILKEKDSEGNDQQVYIVDGNVQMMPDGSVVDKASSDNIVVIYNPATGERKQIDPSADTGISSLGEVTTAEQREADIERSRQEYVQAQIDEAQGTVRFVPGQQLVLPTGEEAVVVATDADGENITVALGDGTQATVQRSELQRIRDEKAAADYRQRHGITEEPATQQPEASTPAQPQADGRVAGAPADYTADMELTIRDEDGSEKPAMVMGRVRYENGSFVPDANGNIIEYFMDGEVKHDHEDKLIDKVVSHVAPQQPEAAPVQEASAETPTVETTPPPVEQQAEVAQQPVQEPVQTVEPQPAQPAEAPAQPTEQPTAEPMPVGEDGEEDWQATTPERAHAYIFNEAGLSRSEGNEFIAAQTQAAQSALVKAKSAQMPRVGTSIKKYNEAKAKRQEKIDEAQRVLDYWQQVRNIQNDIQRVENERRAAEDAVRHDEAVAEAQAEYEARKRAEAERKAVGNENPMPAITEKWNNATKVDGHRDEIMLPDGTPLKGHYVLHESGASSPSHNPETWQKTDGFPMDANDNSVNDRDYERDHDAQEHTQSIARQYDQRALQSVPVVSNDGVVLSGNGRTMAGELAARDNTDGAYVNYLKEYAPKFGFTAEQVGAMQHPRVSFVPDEAMPYTAETFAKFNQQEMKSQNKTEQAVKLGKTVSDDSFKGIVRTINGYDTLGDFYNDAEASLGAVYDLHNAGVVPQAQLAEMVDGIRGQEKLSAVGREFLENMLIGKAFESDPEVVRMLTAEPAMRQTVITALGEIVDNIALGGDWSLQGELADAVKLCFDARQGGAKYGEIVSTYARQGVLFADPDELQTVADFNNATMLMLADVLNDKRVTLLKTTLQLYNNNARQSAVGQADLFAGGIQSREDILRDVITFINENYGKRKEIEAARAEAVERRKAESVQQDGTPPAVSTDGEATAEPSAEPAPVEAEPVEATEPVEAEPNAVQTALAAAEQETNTEPTEAQKEAGNYKKGHVKIDGYDVTIENPKGSVRRGTDASGKQWEQEMQNTYGYIRGTEGVDGDHIDVFFSEDPSQGDVFVVDQVNKDGSFDEHKVMYGFPDIESARKAYLSNYEDGWQGLGAITPVSKEEFKKWIESSHRKTKPFAEYSSVKPLGDTQLGEQKPDVTIQEGEDYVSAAERIAKEREIKLTSEHFPMETQEEAAAFDKRVPNMDDAELLAYMQEDGHGDVNKAHHPSVYDEYDYRHGDEQVESYDDTLVRLNESGTTLEQAEEMLANLQKDLTRYATEERAELLGQEEALQEYITELENREEESKSESEVAMPSQQTEQSRQEEVETSSASKHPIKEKGRLSEFRSKYPDRVFGEQHEDGSVTFHDEDALLVSQLLGRDFDGEDVTLPKEDADKALQKLIANGHKVAFYGEDYKPRYDRHGKTSERGKRNDTATPQSTVSVGKDTDLFGNEQGKVKKSSSETKIDDVGEVLAGARKDMRKEIAKSLANVTEAALVEKPFGKVYKKPDLKKAVESGALREKDAVFYEALFSMVNQQKPKVTQSEMRSKRYIPDHKTKAERWAADTFKQMEVLRQFMELDEPGRDAMMERMLADRYPTREQELTEIAKRKGWNPDYEGHKYEWGEMTTPNPLWVTHEVMNRLGYSVGDKLDVPYGVVKANTSGTGYSIENLKGERASLFGSGMTLDEAIDRIVYLAKLKRGDADVSHPTQLFAFPATKSESGESGRYRVMWGRDYKTREFDSKDDADAFAQTKSGAYVSPIMETKRRFGYKVRFTHPLTGEKMFVDDAEFDTKEEAQAYFDGNFEKLNEATNAKLQDEREMKGEKKTLTADDVVHVTMVHSGKGGWTHAVVIDKKYANNDGQVRIIKEGFASRKDAKAFADSVKDDVLKTVLKHKEEAKKIVYFDTGENSRIGEDYRNGKNVDAEEFMNTFGFRGVQFGNWTNQADRQMAVNQAYDAFMDMARLIGVSPKAMSLNGELGIAFGARGVGGFAAHYEPGEVVINLTKTQGAGSLAHEWWHALDNYFARRAGSAGDMVTDNRRIEMRDALRKAFNDLLDLVNGSDYAQRSTAKGEYWGRKHEITARLLAEWVDRELKKRGELNTFLSRGAVVERGQQHNYDVYEVLERLAGREPMPFEDYRELPESLKGIPYPSAKEVEQFGGSLRHIFDTLEEQVDEETGNVMLYEPTATYETRDGRKVVLRSLFDEMGVRSDNEVAAMPQHTGQTKAANDAQTPSEIRLRKLKKGETCHVERVYEETKQFDFTGKEKVESAEDVAYIFRQLENAAVENSFLVLVKDGRPTVIHLGVGSYVNVMAPYEQALVAYRELKPEQVYFVHNHPSGVLKASRQDQELLKRIKMAFGEDVVQQGIIIDTTSGKYGEFDMVADNYDLVQTSGVEEMPQSQGNDVPVKVYQFSRQVFAPDWNPESAFKIVSSQSVAEFVSSHRLGEHKKMSFLVVNNSGNVVANVFLPWTKLSDIKRSKDAGDLLAGYVHQCGGVRGVLYGNYDYEADDRAVLAAVGGRMLQLNAPLMDALHVEHSAYENGWAGVGEPKEGYGVDATPFHNIIDEMFGNEDFDKSAHTRERYDLGATPEWMKGIGISGERFTLSFKNIKTHLGKDADHNLTAKEWHELPSALKHPFLVTSYGNKDGKFRLYTTIKVGDKFAVVGVDVVRVNQGKGVPMLELNRIKTVFGRDRYVVENGERILAWDKNITPEQEALLRGHNYREYPTIQELSAAKIGNNSDIAKENGENVVEDTAKYRIREDEPPTKTGIGYKVFVLKDGKLYPPMVANPNGEATPVGVWLDADAAPVAGVTKTGRQQVKAGGKGTQGGSGKLAYRPGWHLGEIPYALQFNRMNPETGQRELFPANFVWAEVEYANDVDYQEEAMSYGMNASGKFQHSLAGLPRLPENGSYRYRTNPDPNTDPWVITGAMKVNRILKPSEVDAMVEAAGREPQQRQAGAITDEQVEALNAKVKRTMQEDRDMMRSAVQQMGEKLHTDINIIEDVNEITHPNAAVQERRRKSKGWYDTATGQVNIVLDNNKNIDDVKASVGHETIAHKGLRELVGEENYDEFLDETYQHLRDDLKKGVDDAAGRAFIDDTTKNGKRAKSYEQHRRTAVDELFGRMAEKPFEEFSEGERTLWQKIKATVRRLLDKFLGSLKLPKWFELGDNELRYILWRSKERLERGKEHPIDLARDIVKREELGLTDEARYNMGDAPETFKARQRRAAENKGTVMPGLNDAQVKVVDVPRHPYTGSIKEASKQAIDAAKAKFVPNGEPKTLHYNNFGAEFDYSISGKALKESLNPKQQERSDSRGVHLAVAEHLDEVIGASIEVEEHPDYLKNEHGERDTRKVNADALMHRFYGAITVEGKSYRVMTLMREDRNAGNGVHAYEVTKIEVLDGQTTKPLSVSSRKSNTPNDSHGLNSELEAHDLNGRSNVSDVFVSGAKLLNNLEKSYDSGKKILDESKIADESTDLYRDPDETEDIWTDGSLGLDEMITRAAVRLSDKHRDDKTMKQDAYRAIGGNLTKLRQAMALQKRFDQTTVKRVSDLARVLISSGYLNNLTAGEIKRLLSVVKNSVGHNDIEGDVQKVMDIMVDNQLKHAEDTLHELEAIRGSKVDARGVEVQGQLDPVGAHTMKVFNKTRGWEKTDIEEAISEAQQRMGSSDVAVADEAALEYTGLQLALEYAENIKDSKVEERKLREEIKQAHDDASERDRATDSYRQYIASLQEAIRQNKIERAQSYFDLVGRLSDSLRESIANAKDFKEAEKQRVQKIHHFANSDMQGKDAGAHRTAKWREGLSNGLADTLFNPLMTFEQFMRLFGSRTADGEGYLFTHFMRGAVQARDKEIKGVRSKFKVLDTKVEELFGKEARSMGQLISRIGSLPKAEVEFYDGGEKVSRRLNQGNLMYIYMVNKMLDGRMKLRKMGITEEDVADIEQVLDPRLIEFADWLQDEFLVETRNEYNETHKRMFGASMAAIENYFPLKILGDARNISEDVDKEDTVEAGAGTTVTGAIKKRVRNSVALDITNADALHVILDHVAEMEHWNAYAEWGRDLNTLLSYGRFRNQVKNMRTIYGSGDSLWGNFKDCCRIAAGTYHPKTSKFDKGMLALARGATAAAVSGRLNTSLKQLLSLPAVIPDLSVSGIAECLRHPENPWNWCMENLPQFQERWLSRRSGDPRLQKTDMGWNDWRGNIAEKAARMGMTPNAFVDAVTFSIVAYCTYQARLKQYQKDGYGSERAAQMAKEDATMSPNLSQQSSEGAYLSPIQARKDWLSTLFTIFRNASMSYTRQVVDSARNLKRMSSSANRAVMLETMAKKYVRDGIDEAQAAVNAKRKLHRQIRRDILRQLVFGWVLPGLWSLGGYWTYLLFGDDDDEKDKAMDDVKSRMVTAPLEGLTGGDVLSNVVSMALRHEWSTYGMTKDMPLGTEFERAARNMVGGKHLEALNDMINLAVQMGVGVNPKTIEDMVVGVEDMIEACNGDVELAHEGVICAARILNCPRSQVDKLYFDEIGMSGEEAKRLTPQQIVERYARMQVKQSRPLMFWTWDDKEVIDKKKPTATRRVKERMEQMGDDKVNEAYLQYEEVYKGVDAKVKAANKAGKTDYVKQAEMLDVVFADKDYETYETFKTLDKGLNDIVKKYLGSQSENEASLCRKSIVDYKKAMVGVLEAKDEKQSEQAWKKLDELSESFENQYWEIHDAATQ